jgi:hypothetical protein
MSTRQNVSQFLETNECSNLTPAFLQKGVDGTELLVITNGTTISLHTRFATVLFITVSWQVKVYYTIVKKHLYKKKTQIIIYLKLFLRETSISYCFFVYSLNGFG